MPSVAEETGRHTVLAVSGPASPLIVDWMPEQRQDLEEAMYDGVAIVAFDEREMKLLKDCRVEGKYEFLRLVGEVEVMRMDSAQQIRANLPLAGATILADLGVEIENGSTLDVAMKLIGKKRTAWREITFDDLTGDCTGATHFVRGVSVGAFVVDKGRRDKARAAAEIFGAGASYATVGAKGVRRGAGSLDACELVKQNPSTPPADCSALIRLELKPISRELKATEAAAEQQAKQAEEIECPAGMVLSNGLCVEKERAETHVCRIGDAADCQQQCQRGNASSCDNLSVMLFRGSGVARDQKRGLEMAQRACQLGNANGCVNLAVAVHEQQPEVAAKLLLAACRAGHASGCGTLGQLVLRGMGAARNPRQALDLFKMACDGGDQIGCTNAGYLYAGGAAEVPRDELAGLPYTERACQGGVSTACGNLGLKYEFGVVVKKDPKRAVALFARACRLSPADCIRLGIAYQSGFGVAKDDKKAQALLKHSCRDRAPTGSANFDAMSCATLNLAYGENNPLSREALEGAVATMQPQCEQDVPRACTFLGVAHLGLGRHASGNAFLAAGCKMNDYWACELQKRLKPH